MLDCIKVFSRIQVKLAIEDQKPTFGKYKWHLISICTLHNEKVATEENLLVLKNKMNCVEVLPLVFGDFSSETYTKHKDVYDVDGHVLFTEQHARQIIDFVDSMNSRLGKEKMIVHCDMGVSRSGAVATFISEYLGFDHILFKEKNKGINPNIYILDLLRNIAGLKITEKNSVFNECYTS